MAASGGSSGWSYSEEKQKAYTDSNGNRIESQRTKNNSIRFGPTVRYRLERPNGLRITPLLGLTGIYDLESPAIIGVNDEIVETEKKLHADAKTGLSIDLSDGARLQGNYTHGGIGISDLKSHTLELQINLPLKSGWLPSGGSLGISYSLRDSRRLLDEISGWDGNQEQGGKLSLQVPLD